MRFRRFRRPTGARYAGSRTLLGERHGNFIDIAVLEWCKLFAEYHGAYHFRKVVGDKEPVRTAMLASLGIAEEQWAGYILAMKTWRDKFVAHWDEDVDGAFLPEMTIARNSTIFLLDHLVQREGEGVLQWDDVPQPAADFYEQRLQQGRAVCHAE